MRQIIENLTAAPAPAKKICTVVRPLVGGRYQVRDSAGRLLTVESQGGDWQAGTGVVVVDGRIVRGAGMKRPSVTEV